MIKSSAAMDITARTMASAISGAMGGGPTQPDYTAWIASQFEAQFVAHNIVSAPVSRSLSFATAYQASNIAKPANLTVIIQLATSIAIGSVSNTVQLWIGPAADVTSGSGGTSTALADTFRCDLSVTLITLSNTTRQALKAVIPVGYYFAILRTVGTDMTISSAYDQAVG